MSLDWSMKNCAESFDALTSDTEIEFTDSRGFNYSAWYVSQSLIFGCMAVDMNGITEKNAAEFYARYQVFSALSWSHDTRGFKLSPEMVRRRIGLHTNVITRPWATFLKRHGEGARLDYLRQYKNEISKQLESAVTDIESAVE